VLTPHVGIAEPAVRADQEEEMDWHPTWKARTSLGWVDPWNHVLEAEHLLSRFLV